MRIKVCYFYAIYASPDLDIRKSLWSELADIAKNHPLDKLLGGDFNEVLHANEKLGGANINSNRVKLF